MLPCFVDSVFTLVSFPPFPVQIVAANLFRLLAHYRPETAQEKKQRLLKVAASELKGQEQDPANKPRVVKFGLNHVTTLIENRKAKLVIIAHDVDPIDLVIWLPALCRKMDIPYCIVKVCAFS